LERLTLRPAPTARGEQRALTERAEHREVLWLVPQAEGEEATLREAERVVAVQERAGL
jgi:hypothetical protein